MTVSLQTAIEQLQKDPDYRWGGKKDILLETAKVNAVKLYLKTSSTKKQIEKIICSPQK